MENEGVELSWLKRRLPPEEAEHFRRDFKAMVDGDDTWEWQTPIDWAGNRCNGLALVRNGCIIDFTFSSDERTKTGRWSRCRNCFSYTQVYDRRMFCPVCNAWSDAPVRRSEEEDPKPDAPAPDDDTVQLSWLKRRLDDEEVEEVRKDSDEQVKAMVQDMDKGDDIWEWETPEGWFHPGWWRCGYALVRDGAIVNTAITGAAMS